MAKKNQTLEAGGGGHNKDRYIGSFDGKNQSESDDTVLLKINRKKNIVQKHWRRSRHSGPTLIVLDFLKYKHIVFLTMYFGLPRYIPPRLLGETGVRKQWSTKYIRFFTLIYFLHYKQILHAAIRPSQLSIEIDRL